MNILKLSNQNRTISNEDISKESLTLTESLCSEASMKFGCCEASSLKLRILSEESVKGETFEVSIQEEGAEVVSLGSFTVYEEELTADKCYKDIEAYNAMYTILNADVTKWYETLSFPMTLKAFRDSFFNHLGIIQKEVVLVNDQMTVEKTIEASLIRGMGVITAICELNGCFGHIGRDDIFNYVFLGGADANEIRNSELILAEYEDFTTEYIDKVQIRQEENDVGLIFGLGTNCYVVQDNFLVYGKSSDELFEIASNLYGVISTVSYSPCNIQMSANLSLNVGDAIRFHAKGTEIYSYLLSRKIKGIQILNDTIQTKGKQYQGETVKSVNDSIIQLKGKTNVLKRTIEELSSTITDKEKGLESKIEQNASSIEAEINRATGAETGLSNRITATESKFSVKLEEIYKEIDGEIVTYNVDYIPTLLNYPAWDFTYNIPCNGTVACTDVSMIYNDDYYSRNSRSVVFNEVTSMSYRFTKGENGEWYWRYIGDTDYGIAMQKISELEITTDSISTTVEQNQIYNNQQISSLSSRIIQTSESISLEVTRAKGAESKLSSMIEQKESSILAEVSRDYATKASLELKIDKSDTGQIVSMINASADEINLKGNRISIVSDYFTLEHSGRITAVSGNIGGWDIGSYGIKKESPHGKVLLQSDGTMAMYDTSDNVIWSLQCDGKVLLPGYADIGYMNAVSARVGNLEADHVSVENLNAVSARVGNLEADHVSVENLNAVSAKIDNLDVNTLLAKTSIESSVAYLKGIHVKKIWDSTGMGLKIIWKYSSTLGTWYISAEPSN